MDEKKEKEAGLLRLSADLVGLKSPKGKVVLFKKGGMVMPESGIAPKCSCNREKVLSVVDHDAMTGDKYDFKCPVCDDPAETARKNFALSVNLHLPQEY